IQTADDYEQNQFEYFSSKGTKILYFNEIEEELRNYTESTAFQDDRQKLGNEVGRKLYDFLLYLLKREVSQRSLVDCKTLEEVIDKAHDNLTIYRDFRAL